MLLLGPRGTGKTSLLQTYKNQESVYYIDLLDLDWEDRLSRRPQELSDIVRSLPPNITHVFIDEIQKNPKLLDVIHSLIESTPIKFLLTGSSAKRLRSAGVNTLAGRAFLYELFPLTFLELGPDFHLQDALSYGTLPKVLHTQGHDRADFLRSYAQIYLREEIWYEQFVRKQAPFRRFLEVAAQMSGNLINMHAIAKEMALDDKTVAAYFQILEDTLIGFFLPSFHHSFRKRLSQKPKFYFFDIGVMRTLRGELSLAPVPHTSYYGDLFEHFIVLEVYRLTRYLQPDYTLSFLQTQAQVEVDLVIKRASRPLILIEIKSATEISEERLRRFRSLCDDLNEPFEAYVLCQTADPYILHGIRVVPWQQGICEILQRLDLLQKEAF